MFIKKETLAQVFSCQFSEIFKIIFFCRTPPATASGTRSLSSLIQVSHSTNINSSPLSNEQLNIYFIYFLAFIFSIFFFSNHLFDFVSHKNLI